ncbi:MAG TPA: hypothetical protein PLV68_07400 [Ilumatobacteraceae bacterium]|nr:hypothetical protein [Ilumatobacteraceae bacterium]
MDVEPVAQSAYVEIDDGSTRWRIEAGFMTSNWTCIWGRGCHGIDFTPQAERGLGCCSVGAEIDGVDEAMLVDASAAALEPAIFQFFDVAAADGVFSDEQRVNTRVVDGACIFLNRPGFAGGAGCALHLGALAADESPIDWKPSVCWQLPIKVDWEQHPHDVDREVATLRRWSRADWGAEGETMAWCCTEQISPVFPTLGGEAYCGTAPVIDSLAEELEQIVGTPVFVELRRRLDRPSQP